MNWLQHAAAKLTLRAPRRDARRRYRPCCERLEDRLTPASYTWENAANTLAIHLNTNESLTVTETGGSVAFAVSTGSFTQSGGDTAPGSGSDTITINNADLVSSVAIDNSIAAAGTNNVTFSGAGALSSATIEVSITDPDALGTITLSGGFDLAATSGGITLQTLRNIFTDGGSKLSSTSGNIVLRANQGATATAGNFQGLVSDAIIGSTTGAITLQGRSGNMDGGAGVYLYNGAVVGMGTAGLVTVEGQGIEFGVIIINAQITSNGGNVSVTGTGTGSGNNYAVYVRDASTITAGGSGTVTVVGTNGNTTGEGNVGVRVDGTNSQITSNGGNVTVTGNSANLTGRHNYGVFVFFAGTITAGGSGMVTVVGNGGKTNEADGNNYGVRVSDTNSRITSNGGNVSVTGTGGGIGGSNFNYGVYVTNSGEITAGGSGTVTVVGNGGNATASAGNINHGILVTDANSRISAGSGGVNITATAGGGTGSFAFNLASSGGVSTTSTGNITIAANSMNLASGTSVNAGANTVTLRTKTTNGTVGINIGGADAASTLGLTDAELDTVTVGTLIIGNGNSGPINLIAAITRPASTNVQLHSGAAIVFNPGSLNTAGGTLLLDPDVGGVQPITAGTDAIASTVSFASDLSIAINGTAVDTAYNQLNVSGTVDLTGVDLVLSGSYVPVNGNVVTIVAASSVTGQFNGLPDGTEVIFNGKTLKIAYTATAVTLSLVNQAPQANAGGPYSIQEGNALAALNAAGSSDPDDDSLSFTWDLNGDGTFGDAIGMNPSLTWAQLKGLAIDDGPGQFAVRVRVDDDNGHVVDSLATTLTVSNAAPAPETAGPANGVRGQSRSFLLTATDASATDQAAGFGYSVSWGDGSAIQTVAATPGNGGGVMLDHIFTHVGTFFVQLTATDKDGGQATVVHAITISAVALQTDPREPSKKALVIGGTVGNDRIIVKPANLVGAISVAINGVWHGNFKPTGRIFVFGQDGNDLVEIRSRKIRDKIVTITRPAYVFGDAGNDRLDTWGSTANNVLLGGRGNDHLQGGTGRDLLIGGLGRDTLQGRGGQDILIGGSTIHDANLAALCAIMTEWGRRDANYGTRVRHVSGSLAGGVNEPHFLNSATVLDDRQSDLLNGGADRNWLFPR